MRVDKFSLLLVVVVVSGECLCPAYLKSQCLCVMWVIRRDPLMNSCFHVAIVVVVIVVVVVIFTVVLLLIVV